MADAIKVQKRETRGKRNARRQRAAGGLPAVLYGHGQENVPLTVDAHRLEGLIRHGVKLVDLTGDVQDSALISNVQWDPFATEILHIDLVRVSADEEIEVEVPVETRGVAPGASEGGVVELLVHSITISCRANQIPEKFEININDLQLDQSVSAADIELPQGARVIITGDQKPSELIVVQCVVPQEMPEEEELAETSAEPELVGEQKQDDESGEES